ncbi:MAG: magnesium transporter [Burkholderiales bacterium]
MTNHDTEAAPDTEGHSRTGSEHIVQALAAGRNKRVRKLMQRMHPAKVAALLERLAPEQRLMLWQQIDASMEDRVLPHLRPALRAQLAGDSSDDAAIDAIDAIDAAAPNQLDDVRQSFARGKLKRVGKILRGTHPAKVAGLLEALPPRERSAVWSMVDVERSGKVLSFLHEEIRSALASELEPDDLIAAVQPLELDDLVDLIQALPPEVAAPLLNASTGRRRQQLESMLRYPQDAAGGLMNTDVIEVRADVKVSTVLRYLRQLDTLPPQTDVLMVVDRQGSYRGALPLSALVTSGLDTRVAEVMRTDLAGIPVDTPGSDVARLFQDLDLVSAPVVDAGSRLVGRITVDDVVDLIREDSERAMMQMAGLDDEADIFAPVLVSSRRRALWLGINLLTAFLASWVIGRFQATLSQLVALAVLMPIVASMGGIAGSQTLTLVIRGLALGQVQKGNWRELMNRELGISVLNGLLWSGVIALLAVAWFGDWGLGGVLGVAILINLLCAAVAGLTIPLMLDRMGIDSALAGSVILTTVTDVIGFFAFLGLATWWLL